MVQLPTHIGLIFDKKYLGGFIQFELFVTQMHADVVFLVYLKCSISRY